MEGWRHCCTSLGRVGGALTSSSQKKWAALLHLPQQRAQQPTLMYDMGRLKSRKKASRPPKKAPIFQ
jgi:hypothetical protein